MIEVAFYASWFVLSTAAVLHLLLFKREPSSTIAWLLFVITIPIFGAAFFLVFGPQRLERQAGKRKRFLKPTVPTVAGTGEAAISGREDRQVLTLLRQVSEYGITSGNQVQIIPDPQSALSEMQLAIEGAQKFIHLEYYIIQSDEVTKQLFDALLLAVQRGVEVRILYDALGSVWLKRIFLRKLIKHGAKIAGFLPLSFIPQRLNVNFRNHRKILVIDGKSAFTGGNNIGREYLGRRFKGQWHDYSVRVEGPACRQLQDVFAKDWHFTTQEDLFREAYYPEATKSGDSAVQVLESGPDSAFRALHQAIFLMINNADRDILLTTPYFIPDTALMSALTVAALRGVKVKLLLPLKSDLWVVQYASRSFYDPLLKAGVEIYEYQPRILHAKLLTIDDKWTMLGSANMDVRSFRLNFELNLMVHGASTAAQARRLFERDLEQSKRVEIDAFNARPIGQRMLENACRLFSPIM